MDIKDYTDRKYIPLNELKPLGEDFFNETDKYRKRFIQVIELDGFKFASLVETPELVKKRYEKNVEIKGMIDFDFKTYDYILEISKFLVTGQKFEWLDMDKLEPVMKRYISECDLTLVTSYLVDNINSLIVFQEEEVIYDIPELTNNDLKFIRKFNKKNQHYSINEYTNINESSYETGRKALERLTLLSLYKKTKLGKKFMYTPTDKLTIMMKGALNGN
ncbi:MAG: hypothetical protein KAG14_02245 [Mycoplasmataceae bacterium]|nr:hypothetical protein [Mycoplasmataceae bacterium]